MCFFWGGGVNLGVLPHPGFAVSVSVSVGRGDFPQVVQVQQRYDNSFNTACAIGQQCTLRLSITQDMAAPVYFYYQLVNFYQNHRRYVKSRSDGQLRGDLTADTSSCDPLISNGPGPLTVYPCGLIANSFFNGMCLGQEE